MGLVVYIYIYIHIVTEGIAEAEIYSIGYCGTSCFVDINKMSVVAMEIRN